MRPPAPGKVAGMCPAEPAGAAGLHQAVVTFPGCDLVALIDLNTGSILSSFRMRADGTLEDTGRNPVCSASAPKAGRPPTAASARPAAGASASPRWPCTPRLVWCTWAPTARL
jgi:hypothetical protein